jgi:CheY-like chemotaxis protein
MFARDSQEHAVSHRILLIDCTPRSLAATRNTLEEAGYEVIPAGLGKELTAAIERQDYGLVVLEPVIPGQDGFGLCRQLKLRDGDPPKVLITSRIFRGARFRKMSMEAGADAFLERPQEEQLLVPTVRKLLPLPEQREKVQEQPPTTASASQAPPRQATPDPAPPAAAESRPQTEAPPAKPAPAASQPRPSRPAAPAASERPPHPQPAAEPPAAQPSAQPDPPRAPSPPASEAPARPRAAAEPPAAARPTAGEPLPELAISDDDIEDALSRMLGGDTEETPAPAGDEPAVDPLPLDLDGLDDVQTPSSSGEPAGRAEPSLPPGFFPDDLADHPDGLPSGTEENRRAVLDSPFAFDDEDVQTGEDPGADEDELELVGVGERRGPRHSEAAVSAEPAERPLTAPARAASLLDAELATAPTGTGDAGEPFLEEGEQSEALDKLLEQAFGGQSWPASSGTSAPVRTRGPEETPPSPVPNELRGMDAGTADLLSSLEELENSMPQPGDEGAESAWNPTGSLAEDAASGSLPVAPPPPPPDEQTLSEIFSKVEERPRSAPQRPGANQPLPSGHRQRAEEDEPRSDDGDEDAAPRKRRKWLFFSLVALVGAGGGGAALWSTATPPSSAPSATVETRPAADPVTSRASADDPSELAVARRSLPLAEEPETAAPADAEPARAEPAPRTARSTPQTPPADEVIVIEEPPATPRPAPATASLAASPRSGRVDAPVPVAETGSGDDAAEPRQPERPRAATSAARDADAPEIAALPETTAPATPVDEPVPAPAPAAGAPRLARLGELDAPVTRIDAPPPRLTGAAAAAGGEQKVFLNVLIGTDGTVQESRVMMEPGHGLGEAARQAVARWRYSPPKVGGDPVWVWKTEVVTFADPAD